ncbi:RimK family alpha-L-glutamate ligase [Kitasatospora sp. NPDC056181]|uniref:ATP-grasp domain-containing protein n=1 Tax=Kitasatospora sp. NPDC056181 TaxID=3345737 RepID=UPI0035DE440B
MADARAAFLAQLAHPTQVVDVRPRPVPCVLLLSRACDADLEAVQNLLGAEGIRSARLNADELVAADLVVAPDGRAARLNGRWLTPTVTWIRHFAVSAIESTEDAAHTLFLRESWQAAACQLATIARTAIHPDRPGLLSQLQTARRHRVAVPRTMLTTDPRRARDEFDCPRLVVKAAHHHFVESAPGRLNGVFPVVVDRQALSAGPSPGPPVIVQEYVEHEAELRVYYAAGRIHAFQVGKDAPADPWLAPDRLDVRPVAPPPAVVAATRTLATAMSLRYGAFDFLISAGEPVFLEVNPDGDWRWAEQRTHTEPVTVAVAAMLADLHREASPLPGEFDLLGFLSGPGFA